MNFIKKYSKRQVIKCIAFGSTNDSYYKYNKFPEWSNNKMKHQQPAGSQATKQRTKCVVSKEGSRQSCINYGLKKMKKERTDAHTHM